MPDGLRPVYLRSEPPKARARKAPKPERRRAAPAASPSAKRLHDRLVLRARSIKALIRERKKAGLTWKVGALSPKPRLASWRRVVLKGAALKARTRKRRQVMRRESRRANR